MRRQIENVEVYTSPRIDCYRYALLPIIKHYNRSIFPLYLQTYTTLDFDHHTNHLIATTDYIFDLPKYMQDIGLTISYAAPVGRDNILSLIRGTIDNQDLAVCMIDAYYYSGFPGTYKKNHTAHAFPVFGYDDITQQFEIIDNNYIDSFRRCKRQIPYEDLVNGVASVIQYIPDATPVHIISETHGSTCRVEKYVSLYSTFIHNSCFLLRLQNLKSFCDYFHLYMNSPDKMLQESDRYYIQFNQFINSRILEYYSFSSLFQSVSALQSIDEQIIEVANLVRAIFYKTAYSKEYRQNSFEKCASYLERVYILEQQHLQALIDCVTIENIKQEDDDGQVFGFNSIL